MERRDELINARRQLRQRWQDHPELVMDEEFTHLLLCLADVDRQLAHDPAVCMAAHAEHLELTPDQYLWVYYETPSWAWGEGRGRKGWILLSRPDLEIEEFLAVAEGEMQGSAAAD